LGGLFSSESIDLQGGLPLGEEEGSFERCDGFTGLTGLSIGLCSKLRLSIGLGLEGLEGSDSVSMRLDLITGERGHLMRGRLGCLCTALCMPRAGHLLPMGGDRGRAALPPPRLPCHG